MGFKIITRSAVKHVGSKTVRRKDWSWDASIGGSKTTKRRRRHRRGKKQASNPPNHKAWRLVANTDTSPQIAMPYLDYLKTPYWKAIRRIKLFAAGRKCENCGCAGRLQIHHLSYEFRGREHLALHTLMVLCRPCHEKQHGINCLKSEIPPSTDPVDPRNVYRDDDRTPSEDALAFKINTYPYR